MQERKKHLEIFIRLLTVESDSNPFLEMKVLVPSFVNWDPALATCWKMEKLMRNSWKTVV